MAKSKAPNMYIAGVGFGKLAITGFSPIGLKIGFSSIDPKNSRPTKKTKNNKCLKEHSLQLLFNMFHCELDNKTILRQCPLKA